ncbi:hypothetical protein Glove_350g18 [Diversispora epigaea]|uniref:Uncharacterized protein n=1 Tax=Diversispora epigaea TaxID=1348612 RepID=A0A397HDP6_9GLOM|nr:hypothetical protein Glove_350g18 [Diversispora epigaea]
MDEMLVVFGIIQAEPLILLSIDNLTTTGFPIWSSFICSQNLTAITVETLKRGKNIGNGTSTTDKATILPDSCINTTNTNSLTTGDWTLTTGTWPCFYFNNSNKDYKFIPGVVDQLIITAHVNGIQTPSDTGLIFGVFDDIRPLNVVEPFTAGIPSINTYTFTLTERVDLNKKENLYFTVNKQNHHSTTFANGSIAARFLYSPDTYLTVKYVEKPQYTAYDLISATGGNLTFAIALWIMLFGRGKYKSWGLVHRYIFRNSPDVHKKDDTDRLLDLPYYNSKEKLSLDGNDNDKKNDCDKNKDNDNDKNNDKNKNEEDLESQIEISAFPLRPTPSHQLQQQQRQRKQRHSHYSEPYSATSTFYRKSATPVTFENIDGGIDIGGLNELIGKKITMKINKIVDEKLWSLEQTISRHYLSGFRLRRYNSNLRKLKHESGFCDDDNDDEKNIKNDNLKNNLEDENKYQSDYDEIKPSTRRYVNARECKPNPEERFGCAKRHLQCLYDMIGILKSICKIQILSTPISRLSYEEFVPKVKNHHNRYIRI